MENTTFNKILFLDIYHGEINEEFESNFVNIFGIGYKEFLESKLTDLNNNTKELALLLGLKEKEVLSHLKLYLIIENLTIRQWQQFLVGNLFVYALKVILGLLGSFPLFYFMGYLILYGYFFGATDHSLLDIVIKSIPINRSSCYIAGFIFSGIVAFFISIYKLKGLGKSFLFFSSIYFVCSSTISLLFILFNANSSFEVSELGRFSFIWFFPFAVSILILSARYIANIILKYYKIIGIVIIVSSPFPLFLSKQLGLILSLLLYLVIVIGLSIISIKIKQKGWLTAGKQKSKQQKGKPPKYTYSFVEFCFYILFVLSLFIVVFVPLLCYMMFSTGNYLGSALNIVGLTKSEDIRIKGTLLDGKLIAEDGNYLYISTSSRTLLEVSKDASIQIAKPNELTMYTGKSENWTINVNVYYRDNELWYSGIIKKNNLNITTRLSYKFQNMNKMTLEQSEATSEFYIFNRIDSKDITKLAFIDLSWLTDNGLTEQENVKLNISDLN
ncbi:hypothetical protein [Paenibacillus piscarius]|uniref:hypothetical protein n=1 Tax=Paenibacillus piscarius TaxID=1089681 RepID=UPI001EE8F4B6|nr:hypothetical protein [Paenibacillus piscarius]